ncbi:MAG: sensor histidine kinase [Bryobacteraceae bacterium]|jgi:signal transduction histidine kinase
MEPVTTSNGSAAEEARVEAAPRFSKLRWLLLVVGGALLSLLVACGTLAIRFLEDMHVQQQAVSHALATRSQMLSGLLLSIQSYNGAVQQFVLEAQADRDQAARQHLDQLTVEIDSDLKRYPNDRDSTETALLDGMQDVFIQQRTLYVSVLAAKPDERRRHVQSPVSDRTVALQKQILDWSGKLRTWNGERLQDADQALVAEFGSLQGGLSRVLKIGLGSGLLLVLGSMAYIVRLERQTYSRYVELARSQHELQRLSSRLVDAQEIERRSLSRELHDGIGQALGALLVDIGRLSTTVSDDRPEVKAQLDNMKSVAERTFQSVRNIALLLRPSMLDDLGLVAALEWQGREVSRRSEIEVSVESENVPEDLPDEYRICIYRLVQEALNNAVRHSGARNAKVTVTRSAKGLAVQVNDDGRGFDPKRVRGLGMLGMEERVNRLGGTFTVSSQPGQGVSIAADLPFPPGSGNS